MSAIRNASTPPEPEPAGLCSCSNTAQIFGDTWAAVTVRNEQRFYRNKHFPHFIHLKMDKNLKIKNVADKYFINRLYTKIQTKCLVRELNI